MLQIPIEGFGGLTEANLRKLVPHAFRETPSNPKLSSNYVHVPTYEVIDDLEKLGWYPMQASQRKHRKTGSIFTSHMLRFRNPDLKIVGKDGDDSYPEIILTNSHDGFSSFKFMVGIYRLVCSNGLVIAEEKFADFKIRHMGYSFDELRTTVEKAVKELPSTLGILSKMKSTELTEEQQHEFALKAFLLRKGIKTEGDRAEVTVEESTIKSILLPQRVQDNGNDLWLTYNRIQEAIINGGFKGALTGSKLRKIKKITNFQKDLEINKQLFQLATEYLPA